MGALDGNGSEDGVAVCETIPLVVPSRTPKRVVVLDVVPPLASLFGYELGDLVPIELLNVFLSRADHVKTELEGVSTRSWEVGRYTDGEDFAMGKVDELGGDGGEGSAEFDVVDVVEGYRGREAIAVAWVGTVCGQEVS